MPRTRPARRVVRALVLFALAVVFSSAAVAEIAQGSLRLARSGQDVVLTWEAGTPGYGVYRSDGPQGVSAPGHQIAILEETAYAEPVGASPSPSFFLVGTASSQFGCGESLCSIADEFCLVTYPPIPGIPIGYECQPIPETCAIPGACACIVGELGGNPDAGFDCQEQATGAHVVTIALP